MFVKFISSFVKIVANEKYLYFVFHHFLVTGLW